MNLTKLNLDGSSSVRRIFQSLVVKTLPCSGCFTACMSVHFPVVKLEYVDPMTHCGMVPNGVADSIKFQLTSSCRIEVLACSFDNDLNYSLFWQYFSNKGAIQEGWIPRRRLKDGLIVHHSCGIKSSTGKAILDQMQYLNKIHNWEKWSRLVWHRLGMGFSPSYMRKRQVGQNWKDWQQQF